VRKALYDAFGSTAVLRIADVAEPRPRTGEVLVEVRAAALNPKDVIVRRGKMRWLSGRRFPRGTGYDWAGEVIAIGPEVVEAQVGDRLFGMANGFAGGTCAERYAAAVDACAPMPLSLSFEDAAAVPLAAQTALQALRDVGRLVPGMKLLCLGASGGVGVFAVQLARALGADVTASASAANLPLLVELGATRVIDYRRVDPLASGRYDLVFDIFGNRSFAEVEPALTDVGQFVSTVPSRSLFLAMLRGVGRPRRAHLVRVRSRRSDLVKLAEQIDIGRLRPIIDSRFALDDIAAAHARVETKRSRGKVVVTLTAH
jgi:NADPH:quinone reductase-like Zn-dependent oxidoreductase